MLPDMEHDADAPVLLQNGYGILRENVTGVGSIALLAAIEIARRRFVKRIFARIDSLHLRIARSRGLGGYGTFSTESLFFVCVAPAHLALIAIGQDVAVAAVFGAIGRALRALLIVNDDILQCRRRVAHHIACGKRPLHLCVQRERVTDMRQRGGYLLHGLAGRRPHHQVRLAIGILRALVLLRCEYIQGFEGIHACCLVCGCVIRVIDNISVQGRVVKCRLFAFTVAGIKVPVAAVEFVGQVVCHKVAAFVQHNQPHPVAVLKGRGLAVVGGTGGRPACNRKVVCTDRERERSAFA